MDGVYTTSTEAMDRLERLFQDFGMEDGLSEQSIQMVRELENEIIRNWTKSKSDWHFDLIKQPIIRAVMITFYAVIIVVGVLSNGAVVVVAASTTKIHTVTNIFVINLAISDLGMCLFNLPLQLHYQLTDSWIFGDLLCRVVFSAFALPMYLSTVTILLIALDRSVVQRSMKTDCFGAVNPFSPNAVTHIEYWLIVWPLRDRLSVRKACLLISLNITVSVTMATPVMYYTSLHVIDDQVLQVKKDLCVERWPSDTKRHLYTAFTFFFQFCLPLTLTTILYILIYNRLRKRRNPSSLLARTAGAAVVPGGISAAVGQPGSLRISALSSASISNNSFIKERRSVSKETGSSSADEQNDTIKNSNLNVLAGSNNSRSSICSTNLLCPPSPHRRAFNQNDLPPERANRLKVSDTKRLAMEQANPLMPRAMERENHSNGVNQLRNDTDARRLIARRSSKTNRILVAIVTNFIVCWLPWNIFSLVTEFSHTSVSGRHFKLVDLSLKGFAMASSCVNPLLYCWLNDNLRKDLSSIAIKLNVYRRLRTVTNTRRSRQAGAPGSGGSGGGRPLNGPAPDGIPCFNIQPPSEGANSVGQGGGSGGGGLQIPVNFECSAVCSSYSENPATATIIIDRFSSRQNSLC